MMDAMDRTPVFRETLERLIATRTGIGNRRQHSHDALVSIYSHVSTRMIHAIGCYVDVVTIANIDVAEERKGIFREVLAAAEAISLKNGKIRGVYIEILHATQVADFLVSQGYVDSDPENRAQTPEVQRSYWKDLHLDWGSVHSETYLQMRSASQKSAS